MTIEVVLSEQACPSKLCSGGCKIIINTLMAFIERVVLECMRYWGEFFPPRRGRNGSCVVEKSTRKEGKRLVDLEALLKLGGAGREINNSMHVSDGSTRSRCYGDFWGFGGRPTVRGFPTD